MSRPDPLAEKTARLRALRLAREAESLKSRDLRRSYPVRSYPVLGMTDELGFGKHRGKLLRDVIERDPDWVEWALECIPTFEISPEAEDELVRVRDVRRPPRAWE